MHISYGVQAVKIHVTLSMLDTDKSVGVRLYRTFPFLIGWLVVWLVESPERVWAGRGVPTPDSRLLTPDY